MHQFATEMQERPRRRHLHLDTQKLSLSYTANVLAHYVTTAVDGPEGVRGGVCVSGE